MPRSIPARIVVWQSGVGLFGAVIWLFLGGTREALGALTGGGIAALLSLYFAAKFFRQPAEDARAVLGALFKAEARKLLLAVALFTVAAVVLADQWLPLLTTFMACQLVYLAALTWNFGDGY